MKTFILQTGRFDQTIPLNLSPRSSTLIYLNYAKTKKVELEGKLTLEECRKTLMALGNGKGNGEDGRTAEFYKRFFDLFGQEFLDSVNAAYEGNELSISQRRGVITLIPKEDSNFKMLSNWRPITLHNVE